MIATTTMTAALLVLASYDQSDHENVVWLTASNFHQRTRRQRMFVQFTAPWSEQCQRVYNNVIDQLGERFPGRIGRIDCTEHEEPCQQYGIQMLPVFLLIDPRLRPWQRELAPNVDDAAKFLGDVLDSV